MLDFNYLVPTGANIQMFVNAESTAAVATRWHTWVKPRGTKMVFIFAVGGGASGVFSAVAAGALAGGSGAQTTVLIPAMMIPDILYVWTGRGGLGTVSGDAGHPTYVAVEPFVSGTTAAPPYAYLRPQIVVASANGAVGAASVTGGTVSIIDQMSMAGRGLWNSIVGNNGAAGQANQTAPTNGNMHLGGAGGAATTNTPTGIRGAFQPPPLLTTASRYFSANQNSGGIEGVAAPAPPGNPPSAWWHYSQGGTGGGGATSGGPAGIGGAGNLGAGGGGSGGTSTAFTSITASGPGGSGYCYIISW